MKDFPILIKFIDAKQNLSIQVHPDDEYAKSIGAPFGKNEMWYIMDSTPNAQIISGVNNVNDKDIILFLFERIIIISNNAKKPTNHINNLKNEYAFSNGKKKKPTFIGLVIIEIILLLTLLGYKFVNNFLAINLSFTKL